MDSQDQYFNQNVQQFESQGFTFFFIIFACGVFLIIFICLLRVFIAFENTTTPSGRIKRKLSFRQRNPPYPRQTSSQAPTNRPGRPNIGFRSNVLPHSHQVTVDVTDCNTGYNPSAPPISYGGNLSPPPTYQEVMSSSNSSINKAGLAVKY